MSDIELKPCPFCGHEEHNAVCNCVVKDLHLHFVRCWMCGARTNAFEQKQDAIDAWNRRASND